MNAHAVSSIAEVLRKLSFCNCSERSAKLTPTVVQERTIMCVFRLFVPYHLKQWVHNLRSHMLGDLGV
jgi:hypothetical protein